MRLIAHRGNINGKFESYENEPNYIDAAIDSGFEVEVDVWVTPEHKNIIFLGHDKPQYGVDDTFFKKRIDKLWVHCKNIGAITLFQSNDRLKDCHYFWHQKDDIALTSRNILWTYPDKVLSKNSICVMPELSNQEIPDFVYGICSDHIMDYTIYNVF
jgi:hypothetical protein